jgi:signal transduction histidine kinase
MLRDVIDDEEGQAHVKAIEERTATLSSLSDQAGTVRSLFANTSPTEAVCDVTQLLTEVSEEFSESYPEARLTVDTPDSVHVRADSRLKTAVAEIVENAIIHSDQPTPEIRITTRPATGDRTGEWVEIVIADNGPGIPDHEQKTIESGEETPLQHGTGLGLWIVYWTVSLFGGEVSLKNNLPRGTRAVLSLSQASADAPRQATSVDHH